MNGTFEEAARLARGLMAYDSGDPFRQGYTIGNALISVAGQFDLSVAQTAVVAEMLVEPLVERAQKVSAEFTAANDDGSTVDWFENEDLYPAIEDLRVELRRFGQPLPDNAFEA